VPPATTSATRRGEALHRKLVWLTSLRVVIVTVLLGGTVAVAAQLGAVAASAFQPVYATIAATYASSIAIGLLLRTRRGLVALAYGQLLLDVCIALAVVCATGVSESIFVFMFSLGVVNGAILLYRRGAIAAAALSAVAYVGAASLVGGPGPFPAARVFAHTMAFAATAALASYLAELLRSTGERLAERETQIETITALHESIVQSLTSGLLTVDLDGRVTFLNAAGELMTGLSLARVRGAPADRWFSGFVATPRGELDWERASGERIRLGYSTFPLHAARGRDIGRAVIFQDLTELRDMEAAVQRTQRLADLGGVAAGLAHELRNPLASMSGSIELLRATASLGEEDRRLMDIVLREASRLDELVTAFLGFARPAPLRRARVDLAALAAETLEVFANDPSAASIRVDPALAPAAVECDADQVRQVLWNLLQNAAQAVTGAPGRRGGRIRVACGHDGGGAWLEVEDDGPGIAPGDLGKIFLPFFTTKDEGTGLGLATVHRIVDAHGGTVTVDSGAAGARFRVRLPHPALAAVAVRPTG